MKQFVFTPSLLLPAADADAATFSNQQLILTSQTGVPLHAQTTAALGHVYWRGTKQGSW